MVCAGAAIAEPGRSQGRAHLGAAAVGVALAMVAVAAVGLILMGSHSLASLQTLVGGSGHRVSATEPRALPAPAQGAAQRAAARQLSPGVISALSSRIGSSEPAYWPSRRGGELVARGGGIESAFGDHGLRLRVKGGTLTMSLAAVSGGAGSASAGGAMPATRGSEVLYRHGSLVDYYRSGPLGLEQGFTVQNAARGRRGPLVLELVLGGSLLPRGGGSHISFVTANGATALRYGALSVVDAAGKRLPASMHVRGRSLALAVDDRGARYPLRVDPFIQQGSKLTGGEEIEKAQFGASVALSADGNTALVGGPNDNNDKGAAWVFTRLGGTWTQQGLKLTATGESGPGRFGFAVALAGDGNTALIGGGGDNGEVGAAWVFTRLGVTWTQQGEKLTGSGEVGKAHFGFRVALSGGEGNTALIGGPLDRAVFEREGEVTEGSKVVKGLPSTSGIFAGTGVSGTLIPLGTTVVKVIGEHEVELSEPAITKESQPVGTVKEKLTFMTVAGAAWVFTRSGGEWTQQGAKLTGGEEIGAGEFGLGVALSGDGNTALIGGGGDNSEVGAAWVFTRSGGEWTQQGTKLTGSGEVGKAHFGFRVALSGGEGDTALIGGGSDNAEVGAAWVFTRSAGSWTQQGAKLTASGETGKGHFGYSLALSEDGNTALIGAASDASEVGAAWVFVRSGGTWEQVGGKVTGGGESGKGRFAESVSLSADASTALIGGKQDASEVGAAWAFAEAPAPPPTVTTGAASSLTQESAVLNATVNPNGATVTDCHFEYGTTPQYGSSVPCSSLPGSGGTPVAVSAQIEPLSSATTYHFQIVATNEAGTSSGLDGEFTTGQPPEFGRCLKVAGGKGGFTTASCGERSVSRTGQYEWTRGAVKAGFTSKLKEGVFKLETVSKVKLTCSTESTKGKWSGTQRVVSVVMKLTGCASGGLKCNTPGLGEGEMETKLLEGTLGWQAKATKKVALDLFPVGNTGPYMEYRCGEVENPLATLEGSVLAPVVAGKMAKARLIKYSETGGLQKPERFEGMAKDVLTIVQSEKSEQIGQGASTTQTSEEALEINAVV